MAGKTPNRSVDTTQRTRVAADHNQPQQAAPSVKRGPVTRAACHFTSIVIMGICLDAAVKALVLSRRVRGCAYRSSRRLRMRQDWSRRVL